MRELPKTLITIKFTTVFCGQCRVLPSCSVASLHVLYSTLLKFGGHHNTTFHVFKCHQPPNVDTVPQTKAFVTELERIMEIVDPVGQHIRIFLWCLVCTGQLFDCET